jgi:hypothetical protein
MAELIRQIESGAPEIRFTHFWFSIEEFKAFARELRDIETVVSVFLRSNHLNDEMIVALADALRHNKSIKELL